MIVSRLQTLAGVVEGVQQVQPPPEVRGSRSIHDRVREAAGEGERADIVGMTICECVFDDLWWDEDQACNWEC